MERQIRLGHVAMYARDRKRLQGFYESVLDMKLVISDDRAEVSRLAFDQDSTAHDLSVVSHPNQVLMTFVVDSLDQLKNLWSKIRERGIPTGEWRIGKQGVSFYFHDPEGNRIELLCAEDATTL
ncbi:VOC family protein [Paenibacillus sp. NEAU-GSW1]|uniref:VOC family protein n=1 Tax=Paenibacillus sp. NEAU-GSW1 TaxID=2682486 RepID=UPI0012E1707E|nr:VOC family protein [Paenibacillus sp. NEAU-GSW1]MUT64754.1 hypothetical protein [Paenibacillus sp. NEAU-GSW1]